MNASNIYNYAIDARQVSYALGDEQVDDHDSWTVSESRERFTLFTNGQMTFTLPVLLVEYIYNAGFDDGALLGQISRGPSSPAIPPASGATAPWASITLPEEPAFAAAPPSDFGSPPSHEISFSSPGWRSPAEATDTSCGRWDAAAVGGESPIDARPEIGVEPAH